MWFYNAVWTCDAKDCIPPVLEMLFGMSNLSDSQRRALDQLRELTNGGSDEVSIGVLESFDWNVEAGSKCILIDPCWFYPSEQLRQFLEMDQVRIIDLDLNMNAL